MPYGIYIGIGIIHFWQHGSLLALTFDVPIFFDILNRRFFKGEKMPMAFFIGIFGIGRFGTLLIKANIINGKDILVFYHYINEYNISFLGTKFNNN